LLKILLANLVKAYLGTQEGGDSGPRDPNWHTLYVYVHSARVSNHLTGTQTWNRLWNGLSI